MSGHHELLLFDVDGTITKSAMPIANSMAEALAGQPHTLGFITGTDHGALIHMLDLLLEIRPTVFLLPEMGSACYQGQNMVYDAVPPMNPDTFDILRAAFTAELYKIGLPSVAPDVFLKRRAQMTVSIIGRSAPLEMKERVDPNCAIRHKLCHAVADTLYKMGRPRVYFTMGGTSSIDIMETSWDKRDGVLRFLNFMGFEPKDALYFGDRLKPGGNDWPVTHTGVEYIQVEGPLETYQRIRRG